MICSQLKLNPFGFTMKSINSDLSEVWCSKKNENAVLRRTERVMVRAMCDQKIVDKKTTEEQMNMLGLKETTIFEVLHRLVIGQKNNGLLT